jgi:hypothetical protein
VVEEFAFHLGHHVAGGAVAEGGIKAQGSFAEPFVGGAEQVLVGKAMADGESAGLLLGQAEVAHGKSPLLWRQSPWR